MRATLVLALLCQVSAFVLPFRRVVAAELASHCSRQTGIMRTRRAGLQMSDANPNHANPWQKQRGAWTGTGMPAMFQNVRTDRHNSLGEIGRGDGSAAARSAANFNRVQQLLRGSQNVERVVETKYPSAKIQQMEADCQTGINEQCDNLSREWEAKSEWMEKINSLNARSLEMAAAAVEQVAQLPRKTEEEAKQFYEARERMQADCASGQWEACDGVSRSIEEEARKGWTATQHAQVAAQALNSVVDQATSIRRMEDDCAAGVDQACEGLRHEDEAKRTWLRGLDVPSLDAAASTMSRVASAAAPVPTAPMPTPEFRTMSEPTAPNPTAPPQSMPGPNPTAATPIAPPQSMPGPNPMEGATRDPESTAPVPTPRSAVSAPMPSTAPSMAPATHSAGAGALDISLREAGGDDDFHAIGELRTEVFASSLRSAQKKRMQTHLFAAAAAEKAVVVVAEEGGDVVGAADLAAVDGGAALYVTNVCVHPRARRCGVGKRMCVELERIAMGRGVPALAMHVDETNTGAIALYRQLGYDFGDGGSESLRVGVASFEDKDGEVPQLLMSKQLQPVAA